jgi:hypothetical protein
MIICMEILFLVRMDNNPLTYVTTSAKLHAAGHRWLAALSNCDFKIENTCGKSNDDADGLSRQPLNPAKETVLISDVIKKICNSALVKSDVLSLAESVNISGDICQEINS